MTSRTKKNQYGWFMTLIVMRSLVRFFVFQLGKESGEKMSRRQGQGQRKNNKSFAVEA